ncbi:MAG: hypothetical protein ACQETD_10495 [Pseudomonadota bacterium]
MEFFAYADTRMSAADIQRHINIDNLTEWCSSIDAILDIQGERGDIYCIWGQFRVHRELIYDGVRFTLPDCKNGIQWTVSPNPEDSAQVMVHCTINRPTQAEEFVESLEAFADGWRIGIEDWPVRRAMKMNKPCVNCGDTFGGFG